MLIRKRTGNPVRAHVINSVVYLECPAIHHQWRDEGMREVVEAVDAFLKGERMPRRDRDWMISWSTWGVT